MIIPTEKRETHSPTVAPEPTARWWESARDGRVFCGPPGDGHHIPARFEIPEYGFVQCQASALPPQLLELKRHRESRNFGEAERVERELRRGGMDVPDLDGLRRMAKDAPMCGRWVFLYAIRGEGLIVARVEPSERRETRKLSTPAEVIEYLGIFPRR